MQKVDKIKRLGQFVSSSIETVLAAHSDPTPDEDTLCCLFPLCHLPVYRFYRTILQAILHQVQLGLQVVQFIMLTLDYGSANRS